MHAILEPRPSTALVWHDERISYEALLQDARGRARALRPADERVAVFSENRPEWIASAYAVWAAGLALVPIDHASTAPEVAYVLDDCAPAAVWCSSATRPVLEGALALSRHQPRLLAIEEAAAGPLPRPEAIRVDEHQLAAIVYTSGTTGDPKGVMLTFGNLLANVTAVCDEGYYTPEARVLLLLPLHHVLPLAGCLMAPLYGGGTVVFAPSLAGEELVATMRRHQVTTLVGVPRLYELLGRAFQSRIQSSLLARGLFALAARLRSRRFSRFVFGSAHRRLGGRLQHLISGGAALDPQVARIFDTLGFLVCEGYGMTECSPMISFPRLRGADLRLGSCGQVLRGCEVKVDNGEILARGPNLMRGYYGRHEETSAVLDDGWIRTGDLGRLDEDGYLYVTGRAKEILILPSGKNVNPAPIEAALAARAGIREAGVFLDGDTLHAVVVADPERLSDSRGAGALDWLRRDVLAPYNAEVAPYRRVARATLATQELPRTRLGKLKRHLLPAIAAAHAPQRSEPTPVEAGSPALARIAAHLGRQGGRAVTAESRLDADLGLDSLGRVELAAFLEQAFGVSVPEARLAGLETVGELAAFVTRAEPSGESAGSTWAEILRPAQAPALPSSGLWHRAIVYVSRIGVRLYFRTRARGQDRLPAGPCILAPNHQSFFDGLFVTAHLRPRTALSTLFYAKAKHVDRRWLQYLASRCNVVVASADEGFRRSLQALAAALSRGQNVMIFPEGTRSIDGALGAFKESYAILARELGVPVVPVVIDGAHRALPAGRWLPRLLSRVSVTYLEPLRPRADEALEAFNQRVRDAIATQLAMGRGRQPAA